MCDAFLGEIRMFGGPYAPVGWHLCDGSVLQIRQYDALFTLLGTTYGGDGNTTFGLPDLRCRLPIGQGQAPGLTNRLLGQSGGSEFVQLTDAQMPVHTHVASAINTAGTQTNPGDGVWAATVDATTSPPTSVTQYILASEITPTDKMGEMDPLAILASGDSQPHANLMPYLPLNFIICLTGTYPQENT